MGTRRPRGVRRGYAVIAPSSLSGRRAVLDGVRRRGGRPPECDPRGDGFPGRGAGSSRGGAVADAPPDRAASRPRFGARTCNEVHPDRDAGGDVGMLVMT